MRRTGHPLPRLAEEGRGGGDVALRWPLVLGVAAAIALSLALYLDTLSLPFFQDDVIHIRWLSTHGILDPFLTACRPTGRWASR